MLTTSRLAALAGPVSSLLAAVALGWLAANHPTSARSQADTPPVRAVPAAELSAAALVAPTASAAAVVGGGSERRRRFLVLGDSILFGAFGVDLGDRLRDRGGDVWMYGSCGASSMSFLRGVRSECGAVRFEPGRPVERVTGPAPTPRLDTVLASSQPDAALLVLGTNFLCCAAEAAPDVRALVDRLSAAHVPCLWVGLPSFQKPSSPTVSRHYAMLADTLGDRCSLLDARSLDITFRDVGDRVHVAPESAHRWADAVVDATFSRLLTSR